MHIYRVLSDDDDDDAFTLIIGKKNISMPRLVISVEAYDNPHITFNSAATERIFSDVINSLLFSVASVSKNRNKLLRYP